MLTTLEPAPAPVDVRTAFELAVVDYSKTRQVRALADVLSSGNAGVLPAQWASEVVAYLDVRRNLFSNTGSVGFPAAGTGLTFPKITQHTAVDARGTEKTEVPTQALTTDTDTYPIAWFAGAVDIALELISQSDPALLSIVVQDLFDQYAIKTEGALATNVETVAQVGGATLPVDTYANFIAAVIDTSADIRAASGVPGDMLALTTASWKAVLGLVDGDSRRVLATSGATNADGSANFVSEQVNIGGINVFHSPASSADVQYNTKSLRTAEKPPIQLSTDNVALMGKDVGILGGFITLPIYATGIVKYTAA